jgi:predicted phage tail protein
MDHHRRALDGSVIRTVSPRLAVAGRATLILVVYGAVLYVAAVAVLELVALLSGLAGVLLLFTAGMAGIAAARRSRTGR